MYDIRKNLKNININILKIFQKFSIKIYTKHITILHHKWLIYAIKAQSTGGGGNAF